MQRQTQKKRAFYQIEYFLVEQGIKIQGANQCLTWYIRLDYKVLSIIITYDGFKQDFSSEKDVFGIFKMA